MEDATREVMAKLKQESYNLNIRPSVDGGEDTCLDVTHPQGRDKKKATPLTPSPLTLSPFLYIGSLIQTNEAYTPAIYHHTTQGPHLYRL